MKKLHISEGDKFSYLTIVSEVTNCKVRRFNCKCVCGKRVVCDLGDICRSLYRGVDKSCGCMSKNIIHNGCGTRLYRCWIAMRLRSQQRGVTCNIFTPWEDFKIFKVWSLKNGYTDKLVLCRNKDFGDYTPTNCRWDTKGNNIIEAKAKNYIVTKPTGEEISVYNLAAFCRSNNLCNSGMSKILKGKQKTQKGFKVRRVSYV